MIVRHIVAGKGHAEHLVDGVEESLRSADPGVREAGPQGFGVRVPELVNRAQLLQALLRPRVSAVLHQGADAEAHALAVYFFATRGKGGN